MIADTHPAHSHRPNLDVPDVAYVPLERMEVERTVSALCS